MAGERQDPDIQLPGPGSIEGRDLGDDPSVPGQEEGEDLVEALEDANQTVLTSVGLGFAKGRGDDSYFLIIEEGLLPNVVIHRTLIPTTRENSEKFIAYMQKVLAGGLEIATEMPKEPPGRADGGIERGV